MNQLLENLFYPLTLAIIGVVAKSIYEIYAENRRKRIVQLEEKLQKFYWPIMIRLEKDNAIWDSILSKRKDETSLEYKMAVHVENEVLSNHQEILNIIQTHFHLAEPDVELVYAIKKYIKNVTIYQAIRNAGDTKTFPLALGAEWPANFYGLLEKRTLRYQSELNKLIGSKISPSH